MEAQGYKSSGILGDGILNGMGVSVLVHAAVFLMCLTLLRLMPDREPSLPLCTVNLLSDQGLGGNSGEEETKSAGSSKSVSLPSEPAAMIAPEAKSEQLTVEQLPDDVKDTVPLIPILKTVEKPKEKPKPKSLPKPPRVARAETALPIAPKEDIQNVGPPAGTAGEHAEGSGRGTPEGAGRGNPGIGTGSGMGSFDTAFGSGDGPRFVTRVVPKYPRLARELGREGTVVLSLTIDERGHLLNVEILRGAGSDFDEEAVRAVRASAFAPATRNGQRVMCRARLPVRFVLRGSE